MQLKTYQAKTMSDALAKVKADLGGGAMILHTRSLKRGGWLGIGGRVFVEITATADPHIDEARTNGQQVMDRDQEIANDSSIPNPQSPIPYPQTTAALQPPIPLISQALDPAVKRDLSEIRSMVRDLLQRQAAPPSDIPADLIEYYTRLLSQHVEQELVTQLIEKVSRRLRENAPTTVAAPFWDAQGRLVQPPVTDHAPLTTGHSLRDELALELAELLPPAAPLELTADGRPTIVALVGPTGVGKTTTLAKLAAHMKLREGRRVGLITIDTYRIAAVEQLKTYAQILQIPLIAVTTPGEIQEAAKRLHACDLILIDTAGRSPKDEPRIAELAELLAAIRPDQVHLVLSATSREETLREAAEKFAILSPGQVIFTKLDEAVGFGVIVNVLHNLNLRLSYLTTGQSVPDDIEVASARRVAQLILGEEPADQSPGTLNPSIPQSLNPSYEAVA
ncbi:MAG TPA: flagellar biosynthesis protein FlhF [Phycisphaerae bacterium]|nr:flagellar biosynthesis protein FlhF [Phycisphaerae bacterium]